MSDTDDTEKLLLIPPDHFRIYTSDSDTSTISKDYLIPNTSSRKGFENISERVDRLKLCLEKLENVSTSEPSTRNDSLRLQCFDSVTITPNKQDTNSDTFGTQSFYPKVYSNSPLNQNLSRFASGVYIHPEVQILDDSWKKDLNKELCGKRGRAFLPVNLQSRFSVSSFESDTVSDCSLDSCTPKVPPIMESETSSVFLTPQKKQDSFMLSEIDAFLEGICKVDGGNNSFEESIYLKTPTHYDKWFNEKHEQLQNKEKIKEIDYKPVDDFSVDSFSKCLNWKENQEKCNTKEDYSCREADCRGMTNTKLGLLKSSVPDLGFGMRDIMYSNDDPPIEKPLNKQSTQHFTSAPNFRPSTSSDTGAGGDFKPTDTINTYKNLSRQTHHDSQFNKNESYAVTEQINEPIRSNTDKHSPFKLNEDKYIHETIYETENPKHTRNTAQSFYDTDRKNYIQNKDNQNIHKTDHPTLKSLQSEYNPKRDQIFTTIKQFENAVPSDANSHVAVDKSDEFNKIQSDSTSSLNNLPSLSNLWGSARESKSDNVFGSQKFEEERLRREHCEEMIQQLQRQLLEQQQKISIAVRVDKSKDEALLKLKGALIEITNKVSSVERMHMQQIESANQKLKNLTQENEELKKKADLHKSDTTKALQFAQDCQEKCRTMILDKDKTIANLTTDISKVKDVLIEKDERYSELKESNTLVVQLNKQMSDTVTNLQSNIEKLKEDNIVANEEITNLKKARDTLDDEITMVKNERTDLRLIISEEKSRNSHLDSQKNKLQLTLDNASKKMKTMELEFESFKQQTEDQKNELKSFYQNQVENIVMGKLNEFQNQLDSAECLMDNEMQNKQREIAVHFAKQLHKIEQQHKLEVEILEEKHKEEIKLYRIQLAQSSQSIQLLEDKLASYKNRRGLIAAQLHSVMESQWQQALKIITNGAPSSDSLHIQGETGSQTSNDHQPAMNLNTKQPDTNKRNSNIFSDLKSHSNGGADQEINSNYEQFKKPFRNSQSNKMSPFPNIPASGINLTEDDIQRYVKLLLQKTPGVVDLEINSKSAEKIEKSKQAEHQNSLIQHEDDEYPTSDRIAEPYGNKSDRHSFAKPPWK